MKMVQYKVFSVRWFISVAKLVSDVQDKMFATARFCFPL